MPIRVRFAPSPSGDLHVGNARTALFNWLYARKTGGKFILRVEDTDKERSTPEAIAAIERSLNWLGLDWDEGPGIGGPFAPYRQSQRLASYQEAGERLLAEGKAFWCYSTPVELEKERQEALSSRQKIPHPDRFLTPDQRQAKQAEGRKPALRFIVDGDQGAVSFVDLVRGEVKFDLAELRDFNLIKSDGTPMYNFAAVVDDHLMQISHVLRGEDGISNTPRQLLLYRALGWEPPKYGHLSFILGPDHSKLSKSHGDTSIGDFEAKGYLPEALVNYLGLLGLGGLGEGSEVLSREHLKEQFGLEKLLNNPAVFDYGKLQYLNAHYLRLLAPQDLAKKARPFLEKAGISGLEGRMDAALDLVKGNAVLLADLARELKGILDEPDLSRPGAAAFVKAPAAIQAVEGLQQALVGAVFPTDAETAKALLKDAQGKAGLKGKEFFMPVRVALTGSEHGPELVRILPLLGKETCLKRAEAFIRQGA